MWITYMLGLLRVLILNNIMGENGRGKIWIEGLFGWLAFLILVLVLGGKKAKQKKKFPPGPFAWPVIGHLHLFSNLPHQNLRDASKRYGPLLGLRLGQRQAVVVSSPELAKLVLLTHDKLFADRPPLAFTSDLFFGSTNGVSFTRYGPQWRKHRKLCVLHLFTAKRLRELEYVRQQEMHALLLSIHHQSAASAGTASGAVDIGRCMGQMSSRLVLRLLQSKATMQVGDEDLQLLIREAEQEITPTLGDFIPSLSWLDFLRKRRMRRLHARIDSIHTAMIRERKESACLHSDLLDALLCQEEPLDADEIKGIQQDMIGAGVHTTALSLEWAMAELLKNPHCLHRLQREIDTQLGTDKKLISDEDLPNLSYLKCVVKETFRLHPLVPLLIPRISLEECEVQGYTIPAKTLVFVNVWAIGRDEQIWPQANEFVPERFENKDIDVKGQHFELLAFGSGRRSCVGLPLALSVVETTLANLVSWFDWELPEGEAHTSINMDERRGLTTNKANPVIAIPKPRESLSKLSGLKAYSSS